MSVGTRELKNRLSYCLRRVREGEPIFMTDRGTVIAELRTARRRGARTPLPASAPKGLAALVVQMLKKKPADRPQNVRGVRVETAVAASRPRYAWARMGPNDRLWFLWDVEISEAEFRDRLRCPDPRIRAQWQGALLREATVSEVWKYLSVEEILENWPNIDPHLGRRRGFWHWLLEGWRRDGRLAS